MLVSLNPLGSMVAFCQTSQPRVKSDRLLCCLRVMGQEEDIADVRRAAQAWRGGMAVVRTIGVALTVPAVLGSLSLQIQLRDGMIRSEGRQTRLEISDKAQELKIEQIIRKQFNNEVDQKVTKAQVEEILRRLQ